ncbi:MAG: ATP-binding cassette domain-containing protein [Pseudomonadota bacterium]|nr:ATP-binding cassette domain-containing protein [Pseudomonadota bacterium]
MIEVRELTKNYGPHKAIDRLSFSVKKGEVVGFLGPNGAGKSTTMKIITGYMAPSSGSVMVAGYDVFENPIEVKEKIGYLPEFPPVYGDMFVRDYLKFVANLKKVPRDQIQSNVDRAIEKTNLKGVADRLIQNLSKGFRQRVGIAQAIVSNPEILILDEPTVGLDPKQVSEIRNLIQELAGHHTIILSTHILSEVQATCQRIIIINNGRIVAEDTLAGLSQRMQGGYHIHVKVKRPSDQVLSMVKNIVGVVGVSKGQELGAIEIDATNMECFEKISAAIVNEGVGLTEFRANNLNLEDIFIKLTSDSSQGARA